MPLRSVVLLVTGCAGLILAGCGAPEEIATSPPSDPPSASASGLEDEYLAAVRRARADDLQPARRLVAVRPGNDALSFNRAGTQVRMVTFTTPTDFGSSVGRLRVPAPVWVTPFPQVRRLCRDYVRSGGTDPQLRIQQYVGLPPDPAPGVVVTLRVPVLRLFRPTPDPSVTTGRVDLDPRTAPLRAFPGFRKWYRDQLATAYDPDEPYPWTGRGYTYDWGDPKRPVGASEFVIRSNTLVTVLSQRTPAAYCADR